MISYQSCKKNLSFQNEILENSSLRLAAVKKDIKVTEKEDIETKKSNILTEDLQTIQKN